MLSSIARQAGSKRFPTGSFKGRRVKSHFVYHYSRKAFNAEQRNETSGGAEEIQDYGWNFFIGYEVETNIDIK